MATNDGPEIFCALISPIGVDLNMVVDELKSAFRSVSYDTKVISLIEPVLEYPEWENTASAPLNLRYHGRMDAGNQFRFKIQRNDALAALAIASIKKQRLHVDKSGAPLKRCAYILKSLKTPEEVETFRSVYGANFVSIAAYATRKERSTTLARRIGESLKDPETSRHMAEAEKLLIRDEFEQEPFGQNTRDTFCLADVFVDASNRDKLRYETNRFVEIFLGHPTHTPKRAESAMFHAYGAKLRSSSAGRQVGAAIVNSDGEVLSVGTNEVAKAHGGQYWSDEEKEYDYRDHQILVDSHNMMLSAILNDLLVRMKKMEWFQQSKASLSDDELLHAAKDELLKSVSKDRLEDGDNPTLRGKALIAKLIEYMRSLHAEMAALTSCAKRGVAVKGCDMYVTTFPCHECARLIIASGIENVFFIEPYPKSRVAEMYDDSITLDGPSNETHIGFRSFVGIAPRRYVEFFEAPEPRDMNSLSEVVRKNKNGTLVKWDEVRSRRIPRKCDHPSAIDKREFKALTELNAELVRFGLKTLNCEC